MRKRIISGIMAAIALACLVAGAGAAGRVPLTVMMFGDELGEARP